MGKKTKRKRAGCLATLALSMSQCLCFSPSPFVSVSQCLPVPLSSLTVSPCLSPSLCTPCALLSLPLSLISHLSFRLLSLSLPRFSDSLSLEIKGTQHFKICSHADSLHDSLSPSHATFNVALTIPLPTMPLLSSLCSGEKRVWVAE